MTKLPSHVSALFRFLRAGGPDVTLSDPDWCALLEFADRTQLTLHLHGVAGLPDWLRTECDARRARNAQRRERLRRELVEIAQTLRSSAIDFVVLKGPTHETGFGITGDARVQYDIDLLCPRVEAARRALCGAGYAPHGSASLSDEHESPLVRPHQWTWKGDYFDPGMPIAVEIHATAWSPRRDRIQAEGLQDFWDRRETLTVSGLSVPAFSEPDRLAFAALHTLRHILRNDARPAHVYELARFLEIHAADRDFWNQWRGFHPPQLRSLQAVALRFAHQWFGAPLPEQVEHSLADQPRAIQDWFREFAWSPIANLAAPNHGTPNKDVLWLHLVLVERVPDRFGLLFGRLMPPRLPHRQEAAPYRERLLSRMRYHAAGSALALASGLRWWWRRTAHSTASQSSDWNRSSV